jgi:GTP cyclohydrolase I
LLDITKLIAITVQTVVQLHTKENTMSINHDAIKTAYETYMAENEKFVTKGVKASAARARKALQEMTKGIKERRKEITAEKEALAAAK